MLYTEDKREARLTICVRLIPFKKQFRQLKYSVRLKIGSKF